MIPPHPRPLRGWVWSTEKWARWLGHMAAELDTLESLLLAAYPEGREEHRRARWTVIRMRAFLETLRVALSVSSPLM